MTEVIRLDAIPVQLDVPQLVRKLRLEGREAYAARLRALAATAEPLIRPKAVYRQAYVESRDEGGVVVDGVALRSRVLSVNLENVHRVFPFVVTCGAEVDAWAKGLTDMLEQFWADALMESVLHAAFQAVSDDIARRHIPGRTGVMNPGSLKDWPIEQQRELFTLIGDVRGQIGVELTDSFLMVPVKSVSGLRFPTETSYENCSLCPRDPCPGRRAPYDPDLYERQYAPRAG